MNVWVKPTSTSGTDYITGMWAADNDPRCGIRRNGATAQFWQTAGGFEAVSASGTLSTGAWQMITGVTASATDHRCYRDGANKGSSTNSRSYAEAVTNLGIGITTTSFVMAADADVAEVTYWNVALTDAEVALLYRTGPFAVNPWIVRPDGIIHYYRCLEAAAGDNAGDIAGGIHLSPTSSPAVAVHPHVIYRQPALWLPPAPAAGGGLSIPVASHSYRKRRVA